MERGREREKNRREEVERKEKGRGGGVRERALLCLGGSEHSEFPYISRIYKLPRAITNNATE